MSEQRNPLGPTYDMDTATIARQHAEIMRQQKRIEDMRLEILRLIMDIQAGRIPDQWKGEAVMVMRLEEIRGDPA